MNRHLTILAYTFLLVAFVLISGASEVHAGTLLWQTAFRFRNDNGSESTATWMAATSTNVTNITKNTTFRIRIATEGIGTGPPNTTTDSPQLEYLLASGNTCISAGWTKISTSTSNAFALASSTNFTDRASTTQQITPSIFDVGEILQATNPADTLTITKTHYSEHEYSIQATANAFDNTAYIFRLTNAGLAYNSGYAVCPQVTTSASPPIIKFWNGVIKFLNGSIKIL